MHRDIKSSNLMLTSTGQVKIMAAALHGTIGVGEIREMRSMLPAMVILSGLALGQNLPTGKGINRYSLIEEVELGRQGVGQLTPRLVKVDEAALDEYLALLAANLAGHIPERQFDKTYTVFDDVRTPIETFDQAPAFPHGGRDPKSREPISVAGGFIYVPLSLLAGAENEADVAAALAHALAHIELRHATRLATRSPLLEHAPSFATRTFALRFEREADAFAVHVLEKAGHDPGSVLRMVRMEPMSPAGWPLSPAARVASLETLLLRLPKREYRSRSGSITSTGRFEAARDAARRISPR